METVSSASTQLNGAWNVCVSDAQLRLWGAPLEHALYTWLFPPLCLLGVVGNALNLAVLLRHDIMSRSNCLLSCLAVCDTLFLLLVVPHSLANVPVLAESLTYRSVYLPSKLHLITLANWSSAVAIWLMVLVCWERVSGVRKPLRMRSAVFRPRLLVGLVGMAALLTAYNHFSHRCVAKLFCGDTQLIAKCFDVNQEMWSSSHANDTPLWLRRWVRWGAALSALLVVVVPLVLVWILNALLVFYVKRRSFISFERVGGVARRLGREKRATLPYIAPAFRKHSDQIMQQKTEHRVAITVCAVVTSFTLTQTPSAIVQAIDTFWPPQQHSTPTEASFDAFWYDVTTITSFLVVIGKTLNFVVFCLSSVTFRGRLVKILKGRRRRRNEARTMSVSTIGSHNSRRVSLNPQPSRTLIS